MSLVFTQDVLVGCEMAFPALQCVSVVLLMGLVVLKYGHTQFVRLVEGAGDPKLALDHVTLKSHCSL